MQVKAQLKNLRIAPRKIRLLTGLVKGLKIEQAIFQLRSNVRRANPILEKLLQSALANAENNFGLDRDNLIVYDFQVREGYRIKRWLPRAFGRASKIIKRTSHVTIILEEIVEGKNRKSKEQMEKIRKERTAEKRRKEKEIQREKETRKKESEKNEKTKSSFAKVLDEKKSVSEKKITESVGKSWMKKIFQRKSG